MAATAAGWLAVAWPSVVYLRPLIMKPIIVPESASIGISKTWTISSWVQDSSGHRLSQNRVNDLARQATSSGVRSSDAFDTGLPHRHYTLWDSYQPDNRFWHFQTIEASSYVLLALLLAAATVWWLRRGLRV
jgi:hypothetical protein